MGIGDEIKKIPEGIKKGVEETKDTAKVTVDATKSQADLFKTMWDELMTEMKAIELINIAHKQGEPVDLDNLHDHVKKVEKFIDEVQTMPGAGWMLKPTLAPMRKMMHNWVSEIEKKQDKIKDNTETPK